MSKHEDASSKFSHYSPQTKCREPRGLQVFSPAPGTQHLGLKERRLYYEGIAGLRAIPVALLLGLMPESPLDGNIGVPQKKRNQGKARLACARSTTALNTAGFPAGQNQFPVTDPELWRFF